MSKEMSQREEYLRAWAYSIPAQGDLGANFSNLWMHASKTGHLDQTELNSKNK